MATLKRAFLQTGVSPTITLEVPDNKWIRIESIISQISPSDNILAINTQSDRGGGFIHSSINDGLTIENVIADFKYLKDGDVLYLTGDEVAQYEVTYIELDNEQ